MNKIFTIAKREFMQYFYTPIAYVMASVFYVINGILFYYLLNATNSPELQIEGSIMEYIYGDLLFWIVLFVLIPVITMRLIAEEKKEKTLELILSYPIKDYHIILGKFLGAFLFYTALWIPTYLYVGILFIYQPPDIGPILSAFLGVLLVGAFFISIGIFSSALTENQIIAAMINFGTVLIILLVSSIESLIPSGTLKAILGYLNFVWHMELFKIGVINTKDIIYFLSGTFLFLFLSIRILESRKWFK